MNWKFYRRPAEPSSSDPVEETTTQENQTPSAEAAPATDPLLQMQAELAGLKSEKEEWYDRFLRKAAEFENYRKRIDRERADSITLAKSSVLVEILPIIDAFERALGSFSDAGTDQEALLQYRDGLQLLYRQLNDALTRLGVTPIEAWGEKFDPHLHEALIKQETSEYEENTVIEVLQRGYRLKDRLLRPAQVKVAIRPQNKEGKPSAEGAH